jgi:hypothetical protein
MASDAWSFDDATSLVDSVIAARILQQLQEVVMIVHDLVSDSVRCSLKMAAVVSTLELLKQVQGLLQRNRNY